jgi:hypothetical protein
LREFYWVFNGIPKPISKPKKPMSATVNIICYKSKTLSNGEHPLMIRVSKNSKTKFKS